MTVQVKMGGFRVWLDELTWEEVNSCRGGYTDTPPAPEEPPAEVEKWVPLSFYDVDNPSSPCYSGKETNSSVVSTGTPPPATPDDKRRKKKKKRKDLPKLRL